jgi:preprotein translocase subunit SecA
MDDELLRIFGGERLKSIMNRLKLPQGEPIEAGMVTRSIESSQRKVEGRNFDMRKQLLEYDDVANEQRKIIYQQRNDILESSDVSATVGNLRRGVLEDVFRDYVPADSVEEQWDLAGLQTALANDWGFELDTAALAAKHDGDDQEILAAVIAAGEAHYQDKVDLVGKEGFADFERTLMLQVMDSQWREHLSELDHLRQGIHLRGYAQKNPKQEYKREAFEMFGTLLDHIRSEVTRVVMTIRIRDAEEVAQAEAALEQSAAVGNMTMTHGEQAPGPDSEPKTQPVQRLGEKIGRNDPCWCGSGKKYKACHGKLA